MAKGKKGKAGKKPRTAKQKAATATMIAANKSGRGSARKKSKKSAPQAALLNESKAFKAGKGTKPQRAKARAAATGKPAAPPPAAPPAPPAAAKPRKAPRRKTKAKAEHRVETAVGKRGGRHGAWKPKKGPGKNKVSGKVVKQKNETTLKRGKGKGVRFTKITDIFRTPNSPGKMGWGGMASFVGGLTLATGAVCAANRFWVTMAPKGAAHARMGRDSFLASLAKPTMGVYVLDTAIGVGFGTAAGMLRRKFPKIAMACGGISIAAFLVEGGLAFKHEFLPRVMKVKDGNEISLPNQLYPEIQLNVAESIRAQLDAQDADPAYIGWSVTEAGTLPDSYKYGGADSNPVQVSTAAPTPNAVAGLLSFIDPTGGLGIAPIDKKLRASNAAGRAPATAAKQRVSMLLQGRPSSAPAHAEPNAAGSCCGGCEKGTGTCASTLLAEADAMDRLAAVNPGMGFEATAAGFRNQAAGMAKHNHAAGATTVPDDDKMRVDLGGTGQAIPSELFVHQGGKVVRMVPENTAAAAPVTERRPVAVPPHAPAAVIPIRRTAAASPVAGPGFLAKKHASVAKKTGTDGRYPRSFLAAHQTLSEPYTAADPRPILETKGHEQMTAKNQKSEPVKRSYHSRTSLAVKTMIGAAAAGIMGLNAKSGFNPIHQTAPDSNVAGLVAASFDAFYATPAVDRKIVKSFSLEHNMLATAAEKAFILSGFFQGTQEGTFDTANANSSGPFINFGGCNTVMGSVRALVKVTSRAFSVPVQVIQGAALPALVDPAVTTMPLYDGVTPASAFAGGLHDGTLWYGGPAQETAKAFLRSHNLRLTQCDTTVMDEPLCNIACFDCGNTFEGASDSLDPANYYVTMVNERLAEIDNLDGVGVCQIQTMNSDGETGIPPVIVPVTVGSPRAACAGIYDFLRPIIALADAALIPTIVANPRCADDLEDLAEWVENNPCDALPQSAYFTGVVTPGDDAVSARSDWNVIKAGEFCIIIEFHGLRLTNEALAACYTRWMADAAGPACERVFAGVCNTCKGIADAADDDELELEVDDDGKEIPGRFTGKNKDGKAAIRRYKSPAQAPARV